MKRKLLIYRSRILPLSETFVYDHIESSKDFEVMVAGIRSVQGIELKNHAVIKQFDARPNTIRLLNHLAFPTKSVLFQKILKFRPDIIHAHFAVDAVEIMEISRIANIPLVVTLHGYDATTKFASHMKSLNPYQINFALRRQKLFNQADVFLAVSEHIKIEALLAGFPPEKTRVHYLGIDTKQFSDVDTTSLKRDVDILFVGRLVEKKGVDYLIESAKALRMRGMDPIIKIIGDGPLRSALSERALQTGARIEFLGAQPKEVVKSYLGRSKLLCMPSIRAQSGDSEGLPIVALEAQCSGVPVVAFDHPPISEAVLNNQTGMLAKPNSATDLSFMLEKLLSDGSLRNRLGKAGRAFVHSQFNIRERAPILSQIYHDEIDKYELRKKNI